MVLVPGSLQVDIFVTNIPKDPKPMPPAGTSTEKWKSDSRSGSKLQRHSLTPAIYPPTLYAPQMSQPLTSMEDIPLDSGLVPPEDKGHHNKSRASLTDDYNTLLMHSPCVELQGGRYGDGRLKGKGRDEEMGAGWGSHYLEDSTYDVLDYTHFNGDLDAEVVPAEESLNRKLRQEGAFRREKTRRLVTGYHSQNSPYVDLGQQVASPSSAMNPREDTGSSPLSSLHGYGSGRGHGHSLSLTLDTSEATLSGKHARRVSIPAYLQHYELCQQDTSQPRDKKAKRASIRDSIVDLSTVQSMMPKTGKGARGEEMEIQFSEEELEDVMAMAEYAWPGRPMLDKLLQEEVDMAKGAIVVACEGFSHPLHWSFVAVLIRACLLFHRLRPDFVERFDKEGCRSADRSSQDQGRRYEGLHLVHHGRV